MILTYEDLVIRTLRKASVISIIATNMDAFQRMTGSLPELIELHSNLRVSVIKELINVEGMEAIDAVAEPIWIDGVPIVFNTNSTCYIRYTNKRTGKELMV